MVSAVTPQYILPHTFDHYQVVVTRDNAGGQVRSWSLVAAGVPCFIQEAMSEVLPLYNQRNEKITEHCWLIDHAIFAAIKANDRVVSDGINYRVMGKRDVMQVQVVMRLDLEQDLSGD